MWEIDGNSACCAWNCQSLSKYYYILNRSFSKHSAPFSQECCLFSGMPHFQRNIAFCLWTLLLRPSASETRILDDAFLHLQACYFFPCILHYAIDICIFQLKACLTKAKLPSKHSIFGMQRLLETIKTNMELGPVCCLSGCVFPRQATNSREVADIARYSNCRASNMCKKNHAVSGPQGVPFCKTHPGLHLPSRWSRWNRGFIRRPWRCSERRETLSPGPVHPGRPCCKRWRCQTWDLAISAPGLTWLTHGEPIQKYIEKI